MALAESMALPPPTARIRSTPSRLHSAMPSRTNESLGLGTTPPSSTNPTPLFFSDAVTVSYSRFS